MKYVRLITATAATLACVSIACPASAHGLPDFPRGAVYEFNHTVAGAVDLTDCQVRVQLDTAAEIAHGRLRAVCAELRAHQDRRLTVFGVRTCAQPQTGADIEYGAATLISGGGSGALDRTYLLGRNLNGLRQGRGIRWPAQQRGLLRTEHGSRQEADNHVGEVTFFQTQFFYELLPGNARSFGLYDELGDRRETTVDDAACTPPALESAYFQFDHSSAAPNPVSSLDYAYVRKYANPDPVLVATGRELARDVRFVRRNGRVHRTRRIRRMQYANMHPTRFRVHPERYVVLGRCGLRRQ